MEFIVPDNSIGFLQEYCVKNFLPLPVYTEVSSSGNDHCKEFTMSCKFERYSITATAPTKKAAKKMAAMNMIGLLKREEFFKEKSEEKTAAKVLKTEEVDGPTTNLQIQPSADIVNGNPIGMLQEYATKNQLRLPIYEEVLGVSKQFTVSCSFYDIITHGCGSQKKMAKAAAASAMLKAFTEKRDKESVDKVKVDTVRFVGTNNTLLPNLKVDNITPLSKTVVNNNTIKPLVPKMMVNTNTTVVKKEEEVHNTINTPENMNEAGNKVVTEEVQRLRNLYHRMSSKDPEKWLKMFCESRNIAISRYSARNTMVNEKKVFSIEIPSESVNLEWEGNTEEEAEKQCCRITGFLLLMKHIKEYKDMFKNKRSVHGRHNRGKREPNPELKPFVHLENWLNIACQESDVIYPSFEYQLDRGFYQSSCTLLLHRTTGTGESKKVAKNMAVVKMQNTMLKSADVNDTDNDLEKSRKVVVAMIQINNDLRLEKRANLDEVEEAYKKLISHTQNKHPINAINGEYSLLQGPAVTRILNLNVDDIKNAGFEYIQNLADEQQLVLKTEHLVLPKPSFHKKGQRKEGKDLCVISVQKLDTQKLSFMGVGTTKNESLTKASFMALSQLKILLFRSSTEVENLIFLDSVQDLFNRDCTKLNTPLCVNRDLNEPFSAMSVF